MHILGVRGGRQRVPRHSRVHGAVAVRNSCRARRQQRAHRSVGKRVRGRAICLPDTTRRPPENFAIMVQGVHPVGVIPLTYTPLPPPPLRAAVSNSPASHIFPRPTHLHIHIHLPCWLACAVKRALQHHRRHAFAQQRCTQGQAAGKALVTGRCQHQRQTWFRVWTVAIWNLGAGWQEGRGSCQHQRHTWARVWKVAIWHLGALCGVHELSGVD
mmetsp:Transcript_41408/g.123691  ORF Transcript_41408/g.123691 Transcript_41408/m.123691 type:complete len:214 (-) Transcript_41408:2477-3118(-)